MAANKPWTDAELNILKELRSQDPPTPYGECALKLGDRSYSSVRAAWNMICKDAAKEKAKQPQAEKAPVEAAPARTDRAAIRQKMEEATINPPIDTKAADRDRIFSLEQENARLREQLTWAQHAESTNRTGGLLTLRASDHHYGDANHLLSCGRCLNEKFLVVVEQYQPDRIQIVAGDDWIAGRGIYREQDLDMVTCDVHEQVALGSLKAYDMLKELRTITKAPITWRVMRGNHDYAMGVSMAESLFHGLRNLCSDIPDLNFVMHWDSVTTSLSDTGKYNVLIRHGFGHSNNSPNSPKFVEAVKDEIIAKQRKMLPCEQYRRVMSGHTHWLSVGLERLVGLPFDTTGGLQRNTRIKLGANQRPVGWIAYASPRGMDSDILAPIPIVPDQEVYEREIADPHLIAYNREDAAQSVRRYTDILTERGDYAEQSSYGLPNVGRW